MESLRRFIGEASSELENFNLQAFSESLRDLPQQLLRGSGQATVPTGFQEGIVTGDHKFHFTLKFEPRSEGGGLCQTGVLAARATISPQNDTLLAIRCTWKRRIGEHLLEIPGIHGNMYNLSADDIGMDIVCQAEVVSEPAFGTAYGVVGPVQLDPITRMSLENLISSGGSSFPARHHCSVQDDAHPRDLQIRVTHDRLRVVHPGADRGIDDSVTYSADFPKIVMNPVETLKFKLELGEGDEQTYKFQALSRTSRDLIALLIRAFHSRKYVATSFLLSRLFQNPAAPCVKRAAVFQGPEFDIFKLQKRLSKELDRSVGQLEAVSKVARNAAGEKCELQAQLRETIGSYTEAIEKLHTQIATQRGGACAALQVKLHEARSTYGTLQLELQDLREKLDEERRKAPKGAGPGPAAAEVDALQADIQKLRSQIGEVAGDQQDHTQRDLTRAEELRRLRCDLELLNSEKEGLEHNTMMAEKDKAELIENFVYVKGCLDRLQMASLESPAASPEHERQVAQLRNTYNHMLEERNRVAARVDELDRDRERQKQQREAALERVMNANAKLLEERDRLEREKTRVSELYQRSLGAVAVAGRSATEETASQAETIKDLQERLAAKREAISKREQEGESLRARLRKLAMV